MNNLLRIGRTFRPFPSKIKRSTSSSRHIATPLSVDSPKSPSILSEAIQRRTELPPAFTTVEQKMALHKQCIAYGLPFILVYWAFLYFTENERLEYEKTGKINGVQVAPPPNERGGGGGSRVRERREEQKRSLAMQGKEEEEGQGGGKEGQGVDNRELESRIAKLEALVGKQREQIDKRKT
ncbi:hypothetical protein TrCOL_g3009 [Triparma columacea]|uniref:Uncharacterized protein n=1 Tax=Triparma columacea TaxID=722753 RepID=A0A9W7LD34_9STRA|nr:hypothetical protein TrCOL_g3009 [Triparma columacea]